MPHTECLKRSGRTRSPATNVDRPAGGRTPWPGPILSPGSAGPPWYHFLGRYRSGGVEVEVREDGTYRAGSWTSKGFPLTAEEVALRLRRQSDGSAATVTPNRRPPAAVRAYPAVARWIPASPHPSLLGGGQRTVRGPVGVETLT